MSERKKCTACVQQAFWCPVHGATVDTSIPCAPADTSKGHPGTAHYNPGKRTTEQEQDDE